MVAGRTERKRDRQREGGMERRESRREGEKSSMHSKEFYMMQNNQQPISDSASGQTGMDQKFNGRGYISSCEICRELRCVGNRKSTENTGT